MARIRQGIYPHPFSNCCEKNAHHFIEIFAVVVVIFFFFGCMFVSPLTILFCLESYFPFPRKSREYLIVGSPCWEQLQYV